MANQQIVTVSTTHQAGTFGWRHVLAWRQLSKLWQIPVVHYLADSGFKPKAAAVYSFAIRHGEYNGDFPAQCSRTVSPVVIFLDRVSLRLCGSGSGWRTEFQDHYVADNRFRHVFRLEQRHPLVESLPKTVLIYGNCPIVTPLHIENGMQVLVSLDGVPVVAFHQRRLLVGADPWQLGVPSVPMLYKVLLNWLVHEGRTKPRRLEPLAAIRLDDLPVTAENLRVTPPTKRLDRARSKVIRRLRRFAGRTDSKFTLMYSSHFFAINGSVTPISYVMPRSILEMQLGLKQSVFEIGSHGMVHLQRISSDSSIDPREFLDLGAQETVSHLEACENEILRSFGKRPRSFVAPAWGYQAGITKRIAAERYPIIVDSSQHVESGLCEVFLKVGQEGDYFNMVETFRSGDRMLAYGDADFWTCYAAAGIPIHYMQHTDTNWHILRNYLKLKSSKTARHSVRSKLLLWVEDLRPPRYLRAFCAATLCVLNFSMDPASWKLLWMMMTRSSLYAFARAMKSAGYRLVTLGELRLAAISYRNSGLKDIAADN